MDDQASWASLLTLRQGRALATRLGATLYGVLPCASPPLYGDNDIIAVLSRQGADKVILMTHAALAEPALFHRHGDALLTAASQFPPSLLLMPRGPAASDLAPRVAARLGALFVQEPLLDVDPAHHLVIQQPTFDGTQVRRFSTAELEHAVVAVVTPDPQKFSRADGSEEAEVVVLSPVFKAPTDGAEPKDAGAEVACLPERLVLAGEGITQPEAWESVRQLAERLGAELRQTETSARVGLAPDVAVLRTPCTGGLPGVVLVLGVHGEDDSLRAIGTSSYLIAVHPDREAPVFASAKLALVAEVLPAVRDMLAAAGPRSAAHRPEPQNAASPPVTSSPRALEPDRSREGTVDGPERPASTTRPTTDGMTDESRDARANAPTEELPVVDSKDDAP